MRSTLNRTARVALRFLLVVAVAALVLSGVTHPAQAASDDQLRWIANTGAGNQVWSATPATVSAPTALPTSSPVTMAYRSIATDGTSLYFSDGTNLVRTAMDGTGKTTVVAGVTSAEQIAVAGGNLFYTLFNTGVWGVSAAATNGTPSMILSGANKQWDGVAIEWNGVDLTGARIYAFAYQGGLYWAALNGLSDITSSATNNSGLVGSGITKLLFTGSALYAAGKVGQIVYTSSPSQAIASWSSLVTSSVSGAGVYALTNVGNTIYFTAGFAVGSIGTDGSAPTLLKQYVSGNSVYSIAAAAAPSFAVTYAGNGNDGGSVPASTTTSGSLVVPGNSGNLTKAGYQFQGWSVSPMPVSGGQYPVTGATITINSATTLTARWGGGPLEFRSTPAGSAQSTISFPNTPSGQTSALTVYVRNVGSAAVSSISTGLTGPPPTLTGGTCTGTIQPYNSGAVPDCTYTFSWVSNGSALSSLFTVSYFSSNSVTLTGTALAQYSVAYNGNGSTGGAVPVDASSPYVSGSTVTVLGNTGGLTQSGFSFSGWNTAANGGGTAYVAGATFAAGANTTLYAQWTANGGGGTGGGGSSSGSSGGSTTTVTPPAPTTPGTLGPQDGIASTGVKPGATSALVDGVVVPTTVTRDPAAGGVTSSSGTWNVTVGGRTAAGAVTPAVGDVVRIPEGGGVFVSGSGYAPGQQVVVYAMNPALQLGTFTVRFDGSFSGTVPLPGSVAPGNAVIQVNGYSSTMQVRSLSVGIKVLKDASGKTVTSRTSVYFAAGSSWLNPAGRARLARLVKGLPAGSVTISVVSMGYVQGTASTSNDYTLSTARATVVARQLRADGLKGKYFVSGRGVAKETGAKARRVEVAITYRRG